MTFPTLRLALVVGLALPLGLASASFAQDGAAPPPPPAPAGAEAGPRGHFYDPAQIRARNAEHLRTALQLQPSQDGALNAYLDALRPPEGVRERHAGDRGERQSLTTPERLDRMAARMDERRTRMLTVIAATKQFYAQLSPAQQKAFDDLGPRMMGRRDGHMGGPGMGGPGRRGRGEDGMGPDGSPRG